MNEIKFTEQELRAWGQKLGAMLKGGECLELIGDVGAGKTTFTKALALGMDIDEDVQSPTFTLSRVYDTPTLSLHHYDFYRLNDAGVMAYELAESLESSHVVTVVEWGNTVKDVLPDERIVITIAYTPDGEARIVTPNIPERYAYLNDSLR